MIVKFRLDFVVERQLIPADRAPIRRIKHENHRPTPEVDQIDLLIRRGKQFKVRRLDSRLKYPCSGFAVPIVRCAVIRSTGFVFHGRSFLHEYITCASIHPARQ